MLGASVGGSVADGSGTGDDDLDGFGLAGLVGSSVAGEGVGDGDAGAEVLAGVELLGAVVGA